MKLFVSQPKLVFVKKAERLKPSYLPEPDYLQVGPPNCLPIECWINNINRINMEKPLAYKNIHVYQ